MTANSIITLKLSASDEDKLFLSWKETASKTPPYARWQLRPEGCVITCYESGKTVFQGKDAEVYASPFMAKSDDQFPQAGSDEVGTGDYFGPVCVCAAYVSSENAGLLAKLNVRDSKKISDADIRKTAPALMEALPHSLLILDNLKYNAVHETSNMNAIKAKMHNQAFFNLSRKTKLPGLVVLDQFTPERNYYGYIRNEAQIIRGIHFETKAEDKYPSVAAGSLIARYAFLKSMDRLQEIYDMELCKGAGNPADQCAARFIKKYGTERLAEVAKLHFSNTQKAKKLAGL